MRALRTAGIMAGLACGGWTLATPVQAFELFGFTFFEDKADAAAEAPVPDPLPYTVTLTVSGGDEALKEALEETSILVQDQDKAPSGEPGLISRALADRQQLIARLYVDGRYGGTVETTIAGRPLEEVVETVEFPHREGQPVPVAVRVETGPLFHFGEISIRRNGSGDVLPAALEPAVYGLVKGAPALSDKILAAERQLVSELKDMGHPQAVIADRSVVADHASERVAVGITVEPGPLADFGEVTVSGMERTKPDFIVSQSLIAPGTRYNPEVLRKAARRLRGLGIFSSVRVVEGETLSPDGRLPVSIEVTERKRHVIGGGATISSAEGIGLEAYWRHRNLFGRGEHLSLEGSVGRLASNAPEDLEYSARVVFTKPGVFGPTTSFTSTVGAKREKLEAYESRSVFGNWKLTNEYNDEIQYSGGVEASFAREQDALGTNNYALLGVFGEVVYDSRNDLLDPTEGIRASVFVEPAYDVESGGAMVFTKASVSAYQALDEARRFVLAGRFAAGSILGASRSDIAPSRRYYAGGGGSVRGYAYRNIGPRVAGEVVGGNSFVEGSAEVRVKATDSIGVVAFADAGAAFASEVPDFSEDLKIGVGLGLRYYSALGPLRFDFAVPLNPGKGDPDFAIYVGLSQAF